jgi:hypothetical protein
VPVFTVYTLGAANISISGGGSLSGYTQGDGSHLLGRTITLNSNAWQAVQIQDDDNNFADNDTTQVLNGAQTIFGVSYASGRVVEAEYTLTVRDPSGNFYTIIGFNINEPGSSYPAYGTVEGLAFVGPPGGWPPIGTPLTVTARSEGPNNVTNPTPFTGYVSPFCFVSGTRIATPSGLQPVETLRPGDLVSTADSGDQPVLWAGQTPVGGTPAADRPAFQPICVRAGAFGPGCPARDVYLSRQHRILVGGWQAELNFGASEVLAGVHGLADGAAILPEAPAGNWAYHHLLLPRHEVLFAEGMAAESLYPDAAGLDALDTTSRDAVAHALPRARHYSPPARPILRRWEAALAA